MELNHHSLRRVIYSHLGSPLAQPPHMLVEGEESNLTPTIHSQVNLVPHIFHKGHIHGFALPLSSTSTLIFSHCVIILYHTLGVNVKCLMQIFAFYTKNLLRGEVSSII